MSSNKYVTIDLGACRGRVILIDFGEPHLLHEVCRFDYKFEIKNDHHRCDFGVMWSEIKSGITNAIVNYGDPVSIGVNACFLNCTMADKNSELLKKLHTYRDKPAEVQMENVQAELGIDIIYGNRGTPFLTINDLLLLYHNFNTNELVFKIPSVEIIPDLIHYYLTGHRTISHANATNVQIFNVSKGNWDEIMMAESGVIPGLLPRILKFGQTVGYLNSHIRYGAKCGPIPVVASAINYKDLAMIGTPLQQGSAYVSLGPWSIVGIELLEPIINDAAYEYNFTQDNGAYDTIRIQKYVMGFWLLDSCRIGWGDDALPYAVLMKHLAGFEPSEMLIEPNEVRFLNPANMISEINTYLEETGQGVCEDQIALSHIIFTSLAIKYAQVVNLAEVVTGETIYDIHIIGGSFQNAVLSQGIANAVGLPVNAGPVEAPVQGNAIVQAIAAGRFGNLADARRYISQHENCNQLEPTDQSAWLAAKERFDRLSLSNRGI